ncbi:MAG: AI-2E family transporter [Gemmiger sp.]
MSKSKIWLDKKPESNKDWLLIIFSSIAFYLAMGHLDLFANGFHTIGTILTPFAGGVVIAYVLDPVVRWFSKHVLHENKKLRWIAILAAYAFALLIIVLLVMLVVPQVVSSIMSLFNNIPVYVGNATELLTSIQERFGVDLSSLIEALGNYTEVMSKITSAVQAMIPQVLAYLQGVVSNVVDMFTSIAGSIYMLTEKEKLLRQLRTMTRAFLPHNVAENVLRICHIANENFSGFFVGKIIDSAIIGVGTFVLMTILGISFAPLISVIIGITNIIPVFGPFIGAIPSLILLVFVDPIEALEFLILILIIQQVDGNIIGPKILGQSIGISALWVLFSIVVGGDLLGIVGMVIGVPVFATIYGLMREFTQWCLDRRGIDADGHELEEIGPDPLDGAATVRPPQKDTAEMKS